MGKYEYSPSEWLFPWTRSGWQQPLCDVPQGHRWKDQRIISDRHAAPWREPGLTASIANDRIGLPEPFKRGSNEGNRSMQLSHPTQKTLFSVRNPNTGFYSQAVSAPLYPGGYWVEDNPRPTWRMNLDNAIATSMGKIGPYDCHIILIDEDGDSEELIGVSNLWGGWATIGYARWESGELVHGRPVSFAKDYPVASHMLNRGEYDHVVGLIIRGLDTGPEHFPWVSQRLVLNLDKAPDPQDEEQEAFLWQLATYGASVDEHGGRTTISWADGAQWAGSTLHELDIRLWMFDVGI